MKPYIQARTAGRQKVDIVGDHFRSKQEFQRFKQRAGNTEGRNPKAGNAGIQDIAKSRQTTVKAGI
jgi:hypothetical protein